MFHACEVNDCCIEPAYGLFYLYSSTRLVIPFNNQKYLQNRTLPKLTSQLMSIPANLLK